MAFGKSCFEDDLTRVLTPRGSGVRVALGKDVDEVLIDSAGGVSISRNGKSAQLIAAGELPALGTVKDGMPSILRR